MDKSSVGDNVKRKRFEVQEDNKTAVLNYEIRGSQLALLHTEVPDEMGGKGVGNALAAYAFKYAEEKNLKVKIYCPFVNVYVKKHPELKTFIQEANNKN